MPRGMRDKRYALFERQKGKCAICRQPMSWVPNADNMATIDHKIPKSRRGGSKMNNLRAACKKCNQERGDTWWPGDRHKPKPPRAASIIAAAYARILTERGEIERLNSESPP